MKKVVSLVLVLFALLSLVFVSGCDDANTITVCNWGQYISNGEDDTLDVIAEFEAQTGIKVKYRMFQTNEALYSKMKAGSGKYDVIFPSDYMVEKLINEGMLAKLDYSNIPNFSNIMDDFKNLPYDPTNEYTVPYFWGTVGIIYNSKYITEPVDSWDILWDEQYAGKVLMFDNPRDAFGVALKALGYSLNSTNEDELRQAADLLKKQDFVYVMDQVFEKLPAENAILGVYYAGDYFTMAADNPDLAFAVPEEGTNVFNDAMCIPVTSTKKDLAEQFINFMLEAEIGLANTDYVGYSTPNSAVFELLDDESKSSTISYPEVQDNWEHFIDLPAETAEIMQELWIDVKASE